MSRKVVAYIRVSTEEQAEHGYSIDVQHKVLSDFASGYDLEIAESFVESQSAYKPGRPEFERLLQYLKTHRTITAVLCYKLDRISRNMSDYAALVEQMGVEIISATERFPSNPAGRLMGDMQAAYARFYSAQLSERVADAMAEKARRGIYPSLAPIGYVNDRETRTIIPDPKRASIIREMYEQYANTDTSLLDLVRWAKKRGLRSRKGYVIKRSSIHRILTNPIYHGVVQWGEVTAKGTHQPLIPEALFGRVQDKLHGRGHKKGSHRFPFRGLLVCGYCGCQMTASLIKGKYVYYHCTNGRGKCQQSYIRQEALAESLRSIVDGVQIPQNVASMLLEEIHKSEGSRVNALTKKLGELQREEERLDTLRRRAYVDKLNGVIDEGRWKELDSAWDDQAELLARNIAEIQTAGSRSGSDDAQRAFELLERASDLYSRQSHQEQAEALGLVVSNCEVRGEELEPNYRKPFDLVAEGLRSGDWYPRQDSNL